MTKEITIDGVIGEGSNTRTAIAEQLVLMKGAVTVRINSPGGVAFDGLAIYNALTDYAGPVHVVVDGIAASAASLIAMAGDTISMRRGAMLMIHDPATITIGDAAKHTHTATALSKIAADMAAIYAERAGMPADDVRELMIAETWMTAAEAVDMGFATDTETEAAKAFAAFDYRIYARAPAAVLVCAIHKETTMTTENNTGTTVPEGTTAPVVRNRARIDAQIRAIVANAKLEAHVADDLITEGIGIPEARIRVIDMQAEREPTTPSQTRATVAHGARGQTFANPDFLAKAVEGALYARMSGTAPEGPAREWAGRTLIDMGAALITANGGRFEWSSNRERLAARVMATGQHTTSDFPNLLQGAGQRVLRDAYQAAQSPLKSLAKMRNAVDFRPLSTLQLSEAPALMEVPESGEIKHGSRGEAKESFAVKTFARIFSLSRQAIVNDDLGAFSDTNRAWGVAAANTEADAIVALFLANAGNGANLDDGNPLYTVGRNNKAAAGAALAVAALGVARQAMREMKGLDGKTPINATPAHLVVGPALETTAEQVLSAIHAADVTNANPFSGKLKLHVEARFAGNAWRLFADPSVLPVLEIAYLNGVQAPNLEMREGWNVLGTEFRAVLDFGCGLTEWRGTYLNTGA